MPAEPYPPRPPGERTLEIHGRTYRVEAVPSHYVNRGANRYVLRGPRGGVYLTVRHHKTGRLFLVGDRTGRVDPLGPVTLTDDDGTGPLRVWEPDGKA